MIAEIKISVECRDCEYGLEAEWKEEYGRKWLAVSPCPKCDEPNQVLLEAVASLSDPEGDFPCIPDGPERDALVRAYKQFE